MLKKTLCALVATVVLPVVAAEAPVKQSRVAAAVSSLKAAPASAYLALRTFGANHKKALLVSAAVATVTAALGGAAYVYLAQDDLDNTAEEAARL